MIIAGKPNKTGDVRWMYVFYLLLFLTFVKFLSALIPSKVSVEESILVFCGAEKARNGKLVGKSGKFLGAELRSKSESYEGTYSIRLDSSHRYGFEYRLKNPEPGKRYRVSVWSLNPHPAKAFIIVSAPNSDDFYKSSDFVERRNSEYWDKRVLTFQVPEDSDYPYIKIYVHKGPGPNEVYFDNFKIEELTSLNSFDTEVFEPSLFNLEIDGKGLAYIEKMKSMSIAQGLVYKDGSDIKVKIKDQGKTKKATLRLKGDWLDHIYGKPSYRIEMDDTESWQSMQNFSVQKPSTRGRLRNWIFGQFLDYADVLHPRTDFIWFVQNNDKPVVFSYEEHFTKNLVESQNRREGPIVKLTEDRVWALTQRYILGMNQALPGMDVKNQSFDKSEIKAFKESKTLKNPKLKGDFELAQNLMYQFKYDLKPPSEIFDLDRLAKYLALVDMCLAKHAITWHNQRFYYNPVSSLLEPIGFDAYTSEDPNEYAHKILAEEVYRGNDFPHEPMEQLLYDDAFSELYFKYLREYTDSEFIFSVFDALDQGILARERFLKEEQSNYTYDRGEILEKAGRIRVSLDPIHNSLLAYHHSLNGKKGLAIMNNHTVPLIVYLNPEKSDSTMVYPYNIHKGIDYSFVPVAGLDKVLYRCAGSEKVYKAIVSKFEMPGNYLPRQDLGPGNISEFDDILNENLDRVVLKQGKVVLESALVIPKDRVFIVKEGTELVLRGKGKILSYSPVRFLGTEDAPIQVTCEDGMEGSLTIMQAGQSSVLNHVTFKGQNTFKKGKWKLTGAVSFYESDVTIENVQFISNKCEDALNIIRSEFELKNCLFSSTYGDAFDADFCIGTIDGCVFEKCGNDGIDVSGSRITVKNTHILSAGDKGISVGEMSKMKVLDCSISHAVIGLASKDRSVADIDGLKVSHCQTGFAAFQKKPEFGPSRINLKRFTMEEVQKDYMIEENSIVNHDS